MENLYDNAKFEKVWQKVISDEESARNICAAKSGENADVTLREFMDDEASDEKYYRLLAKKCGDRNIQRKFQSLADEESGHLKKLQIAYFIMNGNSYTPVATKPYITSVLDALRMRYTGEANGEKAYQAAAMKETDGKLSQLYSELAVDEGRHAVEIEKIIGKIIC